MRRRHDLPFAVVEHPDIRIPMPDGVRLAGHVWMPADAEDAPVPAVLEYIPYRKGDRTAPRDAPMHGYMAGHGYACVRVDLRGSGDSEGVLTDEYLQQELDDGCAILRWLAAQPWCSGKVGIIGISWGGFNGLQIAAMRPPELGAVMSVASTDDRYADDVHYMGGCMLSDNAVWASEMFARTALPPDPETFGPGWRDQWMQRLDGGGYWLNTWIDHQRRDAFWRHGSICEDFDAVETPIYAVSGWADGYSDAVLRMARGLKAPFKGLIGPWSHTYPHIGQPGPAIGFLQECVRWWDHWLKGIDTGIMDEPPLRLWMQDSVPPATRYAERPGRWIAEPSWPTPNAETMTWRLARDRLLPEKGAAGAEAAPDETLSIRSPLSVGLYAGKWCSYLKAPDLPYDQREEDGGALVIQSDPLDAPLEIVGAVALDLDIAADKPVAMLAVRLSDVNADDEATRVTYGLLNLTHRDGHATPAPVVPGARMRVRLCLHDTAHSFPAGHRLRMSVSTSYWPLAWPAPEPARLTLYTGASRLHLPVRRGDAAADAALPTFGPPETAPALPTTVLATPDRNWWIVHDLNANEVQLNVKQDDGLLRLDDKNLAFRDVNEERYSFRGNDYSTVRAETRYTRDLRREDWTIEVVTRTILTSDETSFHVSADLDAYEDGRRVFTRSWNRRFARDLV